MKHARMFGVVISISILLALTACGGGGGGDGTTPSGPAATQTYLFYTGSLTALDPVAPGAPIPVESGAVSGVQPIVHGTYDGATRTISDQHNRTIVYAKGANLFKVSALKGATPVATQLSSESLILATGICDTYISSDYADHNNARYVYALAGNDGDCGTANDNVWKMVRIGMSAAVASKIISVGQKPVTEVLDATSGAVTGWLVRSGTELQRLNADFAGDQLVADSILSAAFVARSPEGKIFLQLNDELKMYDPGSGALGLALGTFTGSLASPVSDGAHLYFRVGNQAICRVALDGSAAATCISFGIQETITALALTTNRVVFVKHEIATNIERLYSGNKTGISVDPVMSFDQVLLKTTGAGEEIFLLGTAANRIYYVFETSTVLEDGTLPTVHPTGDWSGVTSASSGKLGATPSLANVTLVDTVASSLTLTVYDAPSHTPTSINTLPTGIDAVFFSGLVNDGYILGNAFLSTGGEIFLVNTKADNSLVRITATDAVSENVVGGCTLSPAGAFDPLFILMLFASALFLLRGRIAKLRHEFSR